MGWCLRKPLIWNGLRNYHNKSYLPDLPIFFGISSINHSSSCPEAPTWSSGFRPRPQGRWAPLATEAPNKKRSKLWTATLIHLPASVAGKIWEGWFNFDGILEVDMVLDVLSKCNGKLVIRVSQRRWMGKLKARLKWVSTKKQNTSLPTTNVSMGLHCQMQWDLRMQDCGRWACQYRAIDIYWCCTSNSPKLHRSVRWACRPSPQVVDLVIIPWHREAAEAATKRWVATVSRAPSFTFYQTISNSKATFSCYWVPLRGCTSFGQTPWSPHLVHPWQLARGQTSISGRTGQFWYRFYQDENDETQEKGKSSFTQHPNDSPK